jgi:hypothetical protein
MHTTANRHAASLGIGLLFWGLMGVLLVANVLGWVLENLGLSFLFRED